MNDYARLIKLREAASKAGKRPLHMVNHIDRDYLDSIRDIYAELDAKPESEMSDKEFLYKHELDVLYDKLEMGKVLVLEPL